MSNLLRDILDRLRGRRRAVPGIRDHMERFEHLQRMLGYRFKHLSLLRDSLVHRSYSAGVEGERAPGASNERLEFLGDSVLSLVVNDYLYHRYPDKSEGELTAAENLEEAVSQMSNRALYLRTLSSLEDISYDQSNTIVFALPMDMTKGEIIGLAALAGAKKKSDT